METLADEILREILAPSLHVPDELFCDICPESPFSRAEYSASDLLLVCKRWLRVATPMLYHTVVVRSSAQAQALHAALTLHPEFGRHVKQLRLEGAYGDYLAPVIHTMPGVVDFCFTLSVTSTEKLSALRLAFGIFKPSRVILTLPSGRHNANRDLLVACLCAAIDNWTTLEAFHFSGCYRPSLHSEFIANAEITYSLARKSTLRTVHASALWRWSHWPRELITHLAANSAIRRIIMRAPEKEAPSHQYLQSFPPETISRLYFLADEAHGQPRKLSARGEVAPPTNPFFQPMAEFSREARIEVWTEIFRLAIDAPYDPRRVRVSSGWFNSWDVDVKTVQALFLVSREFYDSIVRVLLRDVYLSTEMSWTGLSAVLATNVSLARWVRTLRCPRTEVGSLNHIARQLAAVRTVDLAFSFPHDFALLPIMSSTAGHSLRELVLVEERPQYQSDGPWNELLPGSHWASFDALERLDWGFRQTRLASDGHEYLPNLKFLRVRYTHKSFFDVVSKWSLPKLVHVEVWEGMRQAEPLFKKHGKKLKYLSAFLGLRQSDVLECPALETLELRQEVQPAVLSNIKHSNIREIKLNWATTGGNWVKKYRTVSQMTLSKSFPRLKEVHILFPRDVWPATEREAKQSSWPPIAEAFAKQSVTLLDHTGRSWRPRKTAQLKDFW